MNIDADTMTELTNEGEAVRTRRRQQRKMLLEARLAAGDTQRAAWDDAIEAHLRPFLPMAPGIVFGLYWPFKGEFAIRGLMLELHEAGAKPALPRVAKPKSPLEFRLWHPDAEMVRGAYGIPVPRGTPVAKPDVLIVPLVGFDEAGYRLGYGGGYYDRTIAALDKRPLLLGVGYEIARMQTVCPQPHDIPMDCIVTEAGVADHR